jgi:hypothetical protein
MLILRRRVFGPAVAISAILLISGSGRRCEAARPAGASLLPEKTALMISVPDCPELGRRFMTTALGRMSQDPQVSPLVQQFYGSLAEVVAGFREQVGLSLADLLAIPQGELTFAAMAPDDGPLQAVFLLDAGSQSANARVLMLRLGDLLEKGGAKKGQETIAGAVATVYDGVGPQSRKVFLLEKDTTLMAATGSDVVAQVLAAWSGPPGKSLNESPKFAAIMRRCRGAKGEEPQVLWYADPIALMRAFGQQNAGIQLAVAMLPALGLDGLQAVGGTMTFDAGGFDSISQAHLLIENPRSGILDAIALEPTDLSPEAWVPSEVVSYTTFRWNFPRSYKAVEKIYDSIRGEGSLARELERRIQEPTGVDFVKQVLPSLDGRVTYISWIERPVTPFSQGMLIAFKLKDLTVARRALDTVYSTNQGAMARQSLSGKDYYQATAARGGRPRPPGAPPAPQPCFGILDDYLVFADRKALYERLIQVAAAPAESLATALEYKVVTSKVERQAGSKKPGMISFSRPDESLRYFYDLASGEQNREQLKKRAETTPFFRPLDAALGNQPLPPFEVLQRYLAPGGTVVVDDETGLHYTSFALRRK